jgi:hypothetical protein
MLKVSIKNMKLGCFSPLFHRFFIIEPKILLIFTPLPSMKDPPIVVTKLWQLFIFEIHPNGLTIDRQSSPFVQWFIDIAINPDS